MRKTKKNVFQKQESYAPRTDREVSFIKALKSLESEEDIAHFLRDLLTLPEIEEFSNRFEIATRLLEGDPYLKIANDTGTSTTTVTRVAHWLFHGCGGYWKALQKIKNK